MCVSYHPPNCGWKASSTGTFFTVGQRNWSLERSILVRPGLGVETAVLEILLDRSVGLWTLKKNP